MKFPRNKGLVARLERAKKKFCEEQTKAFENALKEMAIAMTPDLPIKQFMMGNGDYWFNLAKGRHEVITGKYPSRPYLGVIEISMPNLIREFEVSGLRLTGKLSRHNSRLEAFCELAMFIVDSRDLNCVGFDL